MKNREIRWHLLQGDVDHLSKALKPLRSYEEVAALLGCSAGLVRQLETSALRKIVHAMARYEKHGLPES